MSPRWRVNRKNTWAQRPNHRHVCFRDLPGYIQLTRHMQFREIHIYSSQGVSSKFSVEINDFHYWHNTVSATSLIVAGAMDLCSQTLCWVNWVNDRQCQCYPNHRSTTTYSCSNYNATINQRCISHSPVPMPFGRDLPTNVRQRLAPTTRQPSENVALTFANIDPTINQ